MFNTSRLGLGRNSVGRSIRIPVKANKENMKFLRSLFFLILFIIKYYPYFSMQTFEKCKLFFRYNSCLKSFDWSWQFAHYSNITMKYECCSNIPFIMFWTDIARFLQYLRHLSNRFINILVISQHYNGIFLNISLILRCYVGSVENQKLMAVQCDRVFAISYLITLAIRFNGASDESPAIYIRYKSKIFS